MKSYRSEEMDDYLAHNEFRKNLKVGDRVKASPNCIPKRNAGRIGVVVYIHRFKPPVYKVELDVLFSDRMGDKYAMGLVRLLPPDDIHKP